uniref:Galactosyltransferase n=1 Tax=Strongyloides venezuelensis TaxID=75913 RepID=A0A0K0FQW2_STRVS
MINCYLVAMYDAPRTTYCYTKTKRGSKKKYLLKGGTKERSTIFTLLMIKEKGVEFRLITINIFLFYEYPHQIYGSKYPTISVKSEILQWSRGTINLYKSNYTLNIFSLKNIENNFVNQSIYKIHIENITSDVIYFMNASKSYSTLNIHFDSNNLSLSDVFCIYCTLQQFIVNKSLHYVNFVAMPIDLESIRKKKEYVSEMCNNITVFSNEENCFLYFDSMVKMSIKNDKEIKKTDLNVLLKPFRNELDCKKLIKGDKAYIDEVKKKRLIYKYNILPMDCKSIYKRGFNKNKTLSNIEKKYSLAFASNVYKNYEIIELKLLSIYSPNNHYCYMVDFKSPHLYHQMILLGKCLPNVYVPRIQYQMKSNGENTSISHFQCMKRLLKTNFDYVFLLQNDEMPLKTNRELIEILETMNFAIDMHITIDEPIIKRRVNFKKSWKFKDLNIFLDGNCTENKLLLSLHFSGDIRKENATIMNQDIEFTNGLVTTGLPRDSVDYLVNKLNITTFLNQLNTNLYGNDELTWQTLLSSDILNVPGHVPKKYFMKYFPQQYYLSRLVAWIRTPEPCPTRSYHHNICSWGVETIKDLLNVKLYFLYRFREEFDYGAMMCFGEYLYNKTNFEEYKKPDLWFYYNSPFSIYKRLSLTNNISLVEDYKRWLY